MHRSISGFRNILLALMLVLSEWGYALEEPEVNVEVNAASAVIMDAATGKILFAKNPEERYPPASTVKIMTAILAIENLPLDSEVTPSREALSVQPTIVGLKPGVTYILEDLISAILIRSGNDAARAIAERVAGDQESFSKMMNEKALKIGMLNTYFRTASGLPTGSQDAQYTTALDLAVMMRYARRHSIIIEQMSRREGTIEGSDGVRISFTSNNRALLRGEDAPWGKTGYTRQARRTFAGIDPSTEPRIVFGLLRSSDLWNDINTLKDKGLELYEILQISISENRPKTIWELRFPGLDHIVDWVRARRSYGKRVSDIMLNNKK